MPKQLSPNTLILILLGFALFVTLTFDTELGIVLAILALISHVLVWQDRRISFPIQKKNFIVGFGIAIAVYMAFITTITFILKSIPSQQSSTFQSVITLMSGAKILQGDPILTFFGYFAIGVIETFVAASLLEYIIDHAGPKFGFRYGRMNIPTFILITMIGLGAAIFHIQSKIGQDTALLITFAFFTVSLFMVYYMKEKLGAINLHIIANSIASAVALGWIAL